MKSMALTTAYLDDSATDKGQPVVVVGGVVANNSSWLKIEPAWKAILKRRGVSHFHASQFENRRGEFKGWDKADKAELMEKLITLLKKQRCKVFAQGICVSAFENVIGEFPHLDTNPYILCLESCVSQMMTWIQRKRHAQPMLIVIEAGQSHHKSRYMRKWQEQLRVLEMQRRYKIKRILTVSKRECILLETADLVAYELQKLMKNVVLDKTDHIRPSWEALEPMMIQSDFGMVLEDMQMRKTLKSCRL
jgi:hypothetical protein